NTDDTLRYTLMGRGTEGGVYFAGSIPNPEFGVPRVWGEDGRTTYICAGPALLRASEELTILPGVEVLFEDSTYYMEVRGLLNVQGTEDNPVQFRPQVAGETFKGVRFVAANPRTRLSWATIENGRSLTTTRLDTIPVNLQYLYNGGGMAVYNSNPTFYNVMVHNCRTMYDGGGVWVFQAAPTFIGCTIEDNVAERNGGGIALWGAQAEVLTTVIRNNMTPGNGGGLYHLSLADSRIMNSLVTMNQADSLGGAAFVDDYSSPRYTNTVLYANTATVGGQALVTSRRSTPILRNSVIENHTGATIETLGETEVVARYSLIEDLEDLESNIDADNTVSSQAPDFTNPAGAVPDGWYPTGNNAGGSTLVDHGDPGLLYKDSSFPPSKAEDRNDIGLTGGPNAIYWERCPLRLSFYRNPGSKNFLEIVVNSLDALDADPTLTVETASGEQDIPLQAIPNAAAVWHGSMTIEESTNLTAAAISGEYKYTRSLTVSLFKSSTGGTLQDHNGAGLVVPAGALASDLLVMAKPDDGAAVPDDVSLDTKVGVRWTVDAGGETFMTAGEVILPVEAGEDASRASIWRQDDEGWTRLETFADPATGTVHGRTRKGGTFIVTYDAAGDRTPELPAVSELGANYPNPFNPSTVIPFNMAAAGEVQLKIYNVMGREVAKVASGLYTSGSHSVTWNGRNSQGAAVASGVYFYRLQVSPADGSAGITHTRKLVLMR
ncbi:T9SS type A sorting domain-containing protein, partial [bacterium]|nr:T9SS type A sorting domain-containing protein [bacterium]